MSKGELPVFRISAGSAFKAGFFGAIGFLVGQVVIVGVVGLLFVGLLGFSLGSLATTKARSMPKWEDVRSVEPSASAARPAEVPTSVEMVAEAPPQRPAKPASAARATR